MYKLYYKAVISISFYVYYITVALFMPIRITARLTGGLYCTYFFVTTIHVRTRCINNAELRYFIKVTSEIVLAFREKSSNFV